MTVTSYPGVYMEEVPGGARPIEAAGTSTAAFFGVADRGPIGEVKQIFSFDEFSRSYGTFRSDGQYLAHAVYHFFNNGGRDCYVGRVAQNARTASVTIFDRATTQLPGLTFSAISPGVWGNALRVVVESASLGPNAFKLRVYEEVPNVDTGVTDVLEREVFDDLSMDPDAARFVEAVVNSGSRLIRADALDNTASAGHGYSESALLTVADGAEIISAGQRKLRINIDDDGWRTVDLTSAMGTLDATVLAQVCDALRASIRALAPLHASTPAAAYDVTVEVRVPDAAQPTERKIRISSGTSAIGSRVEVLPADDPAESVTGALKLGPRSGGVEVQGHATMRPMETASADYYSIGDDTVDTAGTLRVNAVVAGSDGSLPQPTDYVAALHWLDKIRDVSIIAVPGVTSTNLADSAMAYCRNRPLSDCFFIADMPSYADSLALAKDYVDHIFTPNSYGAVYFPWLKVPDPSGKSPQPMLVPPSGFVAGLYAQTDSRRGVWKAPAGLDVMLAGPVGMTVELTDQEHGKLNTEPKSVCVIRTLPGAGMVLWGSRTLSTDPEYKYIPVRRTAIMLRKSIYNGIQWAVFEGNDERLWSALRLNIGSFMNGLFRSGAFQGGKASDAYFVRCGLGDTMTQDDIDRGEVVVVVGFAPLKPAEFVIVRIQQKVGQG